MILVAEFNNFTKFKKSVKGKKIRVVSFGLDHVLIEPYKDNLQSLTEKRSERMQGFRFYNQKVV